MPADVSQHNVIRYYGPSFINGGTTILGDNYGTINTGWSEAYTRHRLLGSLRYPEMNARFNEIHEPHRETFQWVFEDCPAPSKVSVEETTTPASTGRSQPNIDTESDSNEVSGQRPSETLEDDLEERWYPHFERWELRREVAETLTTWLGEDQGQSQCPGTFLIQGKAGSGKSTFMKFLFQHPRTDELLRQAAGGREVTLLFHSFWLVGTKVQHSYKGLIASLIVQLITKHVWLVDICQTIPDYEHKYTLNDWSESDLRILLLRQLEKLSSAVCLFIDGVDEFDRDDDVDRLFVLLQKIQKSTSGCKFCISSRPIQHILRSFKDAQGLRLQDVTYKDIRLYVQSTLREKVQCSRIKGKKRDLVKSIIKEICFKADGVILWAYYVLRNVCGGLRIDDDLDALLKRIEVLPSAIFDLYRHMWVSQDNDNTIHAEEAAKIFGFGRFFVWGGMSVFRLMVAMDTKLQQHYLTKATTLDELYLDQLCASFAERVAVRSAGLIECVRQDYGWEPVCFPAFDRNGRCLREFKSVI